MVSKEPCGCRSNDTHWVELCAAHSAERTGREHERKLDSLQWLINHYERFPNENNLWHVVARLAQVGRDAYSRPAMVAWIRANAEAIKKVARQASMP